jgi:hypothetical protein
MPRFGVALTALLLALAVAGSASAQRLRGRLLDVASNEPLPAGLVTLMSPDGTSLITAVTDAEGYWHIEVPTPGSYYLAAKRMGYRPWVAGPVDVALGDDLSSVYHLGRLPLVLDPIEVSAQATQRYLELMGFYERQRADFGHYVTPEDIARRQAVRITDLLTSLPGVNLVSMTTGSVGPLSVQLRGSNLSQGGVCRPRVFVDGIMYARGDSRPKRGADAAATERRPDDVEQQVDEGLSLDDIGHPSTIAAIEVYRSASQVPVQFGGTSVETLCGVIVIWTRAGSAPAGR